VNVPVAGAIHLARTRWISSSQRQLPLATHQGHFKELRLPSYSTVPLSGGAPLGCSRFTTALSSLGLICVYNWVDCKFL
jgi:hypothetical protein